MENQSTMFSSSECNTWFALFLTESVATVAVNLLSIILFIKNSNLRTRAMYFVINLTVADIFVGGISNIFLFEILGYHCQIVTVGSNTAPEGNITLFVFRWFPLTSLKSIAVISLDRMHATFRPFRHRNIKKMGLLGNYWSHMGFCCSCVNCHHVSISPLRYASATSLVLVAFILLFVPTCYLRFLHLHCCYILVCSASPTPWCNQ